MYVDMAAPSPSTTSLNWYDYWRVYNAPGKSAQEEKDLLQYIVDTVDQIRTTYPYCGVAILGDFNKLNISDLLLYQDLRQVVESSTRGVSVLDLIVTNFGDLYSRPVANAPLGPADHNIITWNPTMGVSCVQSTGDLAGDLSSSNKRSLRRFTRSSMDAFGRWICYHTWFSDLDKNTTVDRMRESFTNDLKTAIDLFFPTKSVRIHNTNKPWMTSSIKQLNFRQETSMSLWQ